MQRITWAYKLAEATINLSGSAATAEQLGSGQPKLGAYSSTGWQPDDAERRPLPTTTSLSSPYTAPLEPLTPVVARQGEGVSEVVARLGAVSKLEHQIPSLERKLRTEPQLTRNVDLRRRLKQKQIELEQRR